MIRLLLLATPRLRPLVLAVLAGVASDLAALALMATATWLIVRAAQHPPLAALSVAIVAVRGLAMARGVFRYGERLAGHDAALRASATLRECVYAALAPAPPSKLPAVSRGDLLSRLVADVDAVQDLLLRCLLPAVTAAVVGAAAVGLAAVMLPAAGWVLAAGLMVAGVAVPLLAVAAFQGSASRTAGARAELSVRTVDVLHGAADLAVFGAARTALSEAERAAARLSRLERRSAAAVAVTGAAGVLVQGLTTVAVTLLALDAATAGRLSPVLLAVLVMTALVSFEVVAPLPAAARTLVEARASARRVLDVVCSRPEPAEPRRPAPLPRGPYPVELHGVSVRYGPAENPAENPTENPAEPYALDGVDLRLAPGRRVALVGPSGSGKSTLLACLLRFVEPDSGRVTVGGADLRDLASADLRRVVRGMTQDAHVFHASIAANLRLARPDASDAELAEAARRACLLGWIESLPEGWDTVVGEDGGTLSGGQRQRLLLARELLADPPVLLLDEPAESLDPETADAVLAETLAATEGRTALLVTHRLTGLEAVDEIAVLDAGRVVQRGHHDELVRRPGYYQEVWLAEQFTAGGRSSLPAPQTTDIVG